ncbi:sugar ABC transporter substrate-binding protein [Telmatospirillum sp.]|uniref:ABC transporter substrate-binding protein n=1 Tax=Telmatospirillum sp. TaxID=2079197 RepID=UPI00283CFCE3|nr:sugar ABC transporter substrate-binding protein [Telmatospirillum sp.]MDR3441196.1 sugar ABC transporter substrate-binding protein [Telmatospirillum sp.]
MKMLAFKLGLGVIVAVVSIHNASADPVTLQVWAQDEISHYTQVLTRDFEAKNPDIRIDLKLINFADVENDAIRAAATNTAPDVSQIDNPQVATFASHNLLLDLGPFVANSKVIHREDFYPGPLTNATWQDRLYAIPRGANTIALFYNADMFRAAGLNPDAPPKTWDELYTVARKLTDPAAHRYGLAYSAVATEEGTFQFLPFAQTAGGDFDHLDNPGTVRALEFWQKLLDEKIVSNDVLVWGQVDLMASFRAQNVAMAISGPWELPTLDREAKFDWRVAMLPVEKEGSPRASALGEHAYGVFKSSKHPQEAFRLLEYFISQQGRNWNEFGILPSVKTVTTVNPKWPAAYAIFAEEVQYAHARGPSPMWPQISKPIQVAIQTALTHRADAKTALAEAQRHVDQVLKK